MSSYKSILVSKGAGGFGGPLTITPTDDKHKFIYITGGGEKPAIVDKIVELTGMEAVNGFKTSIPDEEIALAIVDCGGTLRCGIYPKKGIPTINIVPTGKSGPLAQYITEDIYVSAVGLDQIQPTDGSAVVVQKSEKKEETKYDTSRKLTEQRADKSFIAKYRIYSADDSVYCTFKRLVKHVFRLFNGILLPIH